MANPKFDTQLTRFIQRGRKRKPNSPYRPAKRSGIPASSRPVKRGTSGY